MNPKSMLSLWRERWGKAAGTSFKVPYVNGKVNEWTDWLPYSGAWSAAGMPTLALLLCMLSMGLMISISLSFTSQVEFSIIFVCIALYLRRYAGLLITLVLVGMSVVASARYLYWRFDATLTPDFNLNFLFSFCFFIAETYLALLVFTGLVQVIWPLKRASVVLPETQEEWPTVDVYILCDDQQYAAIKLTTTTASQLDWPRKKLKIYLIDGMHRDDLYVLAASIGAHYLPHSDESGNHIGFVNRSLPSTNGDFIAIFESGQAPGHQFIKSTIGWFLRNPKLVIAQTPHHFLVPSQAKRSLEVINLQDSELSCAVIRRSVIVQMGGFDATAATHNSHMALTLQASGYESAYIGLKTLDDDLRADINAKTIQTTIANNPPNISPKTLSNIFLVEYPFASQSLRLKQNIALFHSALQFFYPAFRLLFFVVPVAYLLGHIQFIQTTPQLFIAYAVPHFLHAYIAGTRTDEKVRYKMFTDIRETALAWYMLIPTTLTLLKTQFKQSFTIWFVNKPPSTRKLPKTSSTGLTSIFTPVVSTIYVVVLGLNLAGLFAGLVDIFLYSTGQKDTIALYCLWATYNLMLLAGMFAVAQEAKQIKLHTNAQLCLPAMIKLPSGRTLSCVTENFPAFVLELSLPMPVVVEAGAVVSISIFHAHRELVFPATVVTRQDLMLEVRIAQADQKSYQLFANSVLARGPDWPKWLPGRSADRLLPKRVTDAFVSTLVAVLNFAIDINKYLHWVRLNNWIELWKKKK